MSVEIDLYWEFLVEEKHVEELLKAQEALQKLVSEGTTSGSFFIDDGKHEVQWSIRLN